MVFASVNGQLQKTKNGSTAALMLILELLFVQMFHQVFREHSQGGSRLAGIPVFHRSLWSFLCNFPQCQAKQKLGWNISVSGRFQTLYGHKQTVVKCLEFCYNKYSIGPGVLSFFSGLFLPHVSLNRHQENQHPTVFKVDRPSVSRTPVDKILLHQRSLKLCTHILLRLSPSWLSSLIFSGIRSSDITYRWQKQRETEGVLVPKHNLSRGSSPGSEPAVSILSGSSTAKPHLCTLGCFHCAAAQTKSAVAGESSTGV